MRPTSSPPRLPSSPRSAWTTPTFSGDTIAAIAGEKAGIIARQQPDLVPAGTDPSTVAVIARQAPEAMEVLMAQAVTADAAVAREDSEFAVRGRQVAIGGQMLELQGLACTPTSSCRCNGDIRRTMPSWRSPRSRRFSAPAPTVSSISTPCAKDSPRCAILVAWSGCAVRQRRSIDAAHNPAGAAALADALESEFGSGSWSASSPSWRTRTSAAS
ncbi:Dihydrofolate synthase/folylpolyglutamate synthase [Mycolicibacterium aubagnense]